MSLVMVVGRALASRAFWTLLGCSSGQGGTGGMGTSMFQCLGFFGLFYRFSGQHCTST